MTAIETARLRETALNMARNLHPNTYPPTQNPGSYGLNNVNPITPATKTILDTAEEIFNWLTKS